MFSIPRESPAFQCQSLSMFVFILAVLEKWEEYFSTSQPSSCK